MSFASTIFWLAAAAMIAVALSFVLRGLRARGNPPRGPTRAAINASIYRAELDELERDRESGAIDPADFERARAELQRRLLDDVAQTPQGGAAPGLRGAGVAIGAALPVLAVALYVAFGTPAAIDAEYRVPEGAVEATGEGYRERLAAHLAAAPRDGRAWIALARLDMSEDRFDAAARHYAKALDASQKIARDAAVICEYADALGMAQGGRLEGRPSELIDRALAIDPANHTALEMAGSAAYERRDFRTAARHWRALLGRLDSGTAAHAELAAALERVERLASTTLPSGPSIAAPRGG